jgi:hypothetical protein
MPWCYVINGDSDRTVIGRMVTVSKSQLTTYPMHIDDISEKKSSIIL